MASAQQTFTKPRKKVIRVTKDVPRFNGTAISRKETMHKSNNYFSACPKAQQLEIYLYSLEGDSFTESQLFGRWSVSYHLICWFVEASDRSSSSSSSSTHQCEFSNTTGALSAIFRQSFTYLISLFLRLSLSSTFPITFLQLYVSLFPTLFPR